MNRTRCSSSMVSGSNSTSLQDLENLMFTKLNCLMVVVAQAGQNHTKLL